MYRAAPVARDKGMQVIAGDLNREWSELEVVELIAELAAREGAVA